MPGLALADDPPTVADTTEGQMSLDIPTPTKNVLKLITRAITLPDQVAFEMHDEVEIKLLVRIEELAAKSPLDDFGNVKGCEVTHRAKVLRYSGSGFDIEVSPHGDDNAGDDDQ